MNKTLTAKLAALREVLRDIGPAAVAVSGGVDSMTLAVIAHRLAPKKVKIVHAISPAVPPEATQRIRSYAELEGWDLQVLDAGEFDDPEYLKNPSNRCFFCKSNLYGAIARCITATILSGTNLDDLDDFRPGLTAARQFDVRHPFVEVGIDKSSVRKLARNMGFSDLSELPAAPCLSSRIETGLRIQPDVLGVVHQVEKLVRRQISPTTARCRIRKSGVVVELDERSFISLSEERLIALSDSIAGMLGDNLEGQTVSFSAYQMGSAFLRSESQ